MSWVYVGAIYLVISALWMWFFLKRKAFSKKRIGAWIGAVLAAVCWPLGGLLVAVALWRQSNCESCENTMAHYERNKHKVYGAKVFKK